MNHNDVDGFSIEELDSLFDTDDQPESSPVDDSAVSQDGQQESTPVDTTKAFAKRLRESTDKARSEERENIAKTLGYESYAKMLEERQNKVLSDKGLDPTEVSPVIDQLVQERLNNDPRMKELDEYRKQQIKEYGKKELAEITQLTDGAITSFSQLPKEVIDLWSAKGSLKAAYLELEGENLITRIKSEQSKGTTAHLATAAGGAPAPSKQRPLTAEEKEVWKFFNPTMTDEELNNKMVDK